MAEPCNAWIAIAHSVEFVGAVVRVQQSRSKIRWSLDNDEPGITLCGSDSVIRCRLDVRFARKRIGWPKSPRGLAGRLRRAQSFLRTLGIEIAFGREGRLGA